MTRVANRFTDPASGGIYDWPLNHSWQGESEHGPSRTIDKSATTSGTGVVRQQGAETPDQLALQGTILEKNQHDAFRVWTALCRSQTIFFTDFAGNAWEVQIVSYRYHQEGVVHNPRGGAEAPSHLWRYTLTMDVIRELT